MQTGVVQRKPKAVRLSPEIQGKIGQQLRAMYDDLVKEGVPDRLTDLMRQLDEQVLAQRTDNPSNGQADQSPETQQSLETQKDREPG
jgi:hypothetical protein